jgi:hypothetical protein
MSRWLTERGILWLSHQFDRTQNQLYFNKSLFV